MKQSKRRRGFTLVELVIVIAVIAILAAVLIPTFTSVIQKANMSADQQTVRNMNVALTAEEVAGNVPDGLAGAETILRSAGLNAPVDTASSGYAFYWIQKSGEQSVNRVVLVEMNGKNPVSIVYPADLAAKYEMAALTWFSLAPTTEACLHLVGYGYTYRPIALETGGSEFHLVICGKCHEVIVMDAPHDTDGADGACSKCGWKKETNSDTDPCAHAYGVGSYTANGDGTHTKVCKICNQPTQEDCTFDAAGRCVYCDYDQPVSTHRHVFEYTPQNNGTHNRRCTDSACPDNGAPATGLACTFEYRKDEGYYCIYCNAKAPEGFEPLGGTAGGVANGYYYKNNRLYTGTVAGHSYEYGKLVVETESSQTGTDKYDLSWQFQLPDDENYLTDRVSLQFELKRPSSTMPGDGVNNKVKFGGGKNLYAAVNVKTTFDMNVLGAITMLKTAVESGNTEGILEKIKEIYGFDEHYYPVMTSSVTALTYAHEVLGTTDREWSQASYNAYMEQLSKPEGQTLADWLKKRYHADTMDDIAWSDILNIQNGVWESSNQGSNFVDGNASAYHYSEPEIVLWYWNIYYGNIYWYGISDKDTTPLYNEARDSTKTNNVYKWVDKDWKEQVRNAFDALSVCSGLELVDGISLKNTALQDNTFYLMESYHMYFGGNVSMGMYEPTQEIIIMLEKQGA